ncbi:hypothetical protein [Demequina aestuarii]|uniref:hypothetical protein n=1 Tax=Demequina aestuarii TaxID=327095 RepID=UPI00128B8AE2|nr:hypothetical protein [Demequina aestuarii]
MVAVLYVIILLIARILPSPHPRDGAWVLATLASAAAFIASTQDVSLFPSSVPLVPTAVALIGLGLLAVVAGVLEDWRQGTRGDERFLSPSRKPTGRAWENLGTNTAGAGAASAVIWVVSELPVDPKDGLTGDVLANILLPLVVLVVLAFVRTQQLKVEPAIDARIARKDPWPPESRHHSLTSPHVLINTLFLVFVTYVGFAGYVLTMVALISSAKDGASLPLSLSVAIFLSAGIAFLLACGYPRKQKDPFVYMTFLTGVPMAMGASLFTLAMLESSSERNVFALLFFAVTAAVYGVFVLRRETQDRRKNWRDDAHYFAAFAIGLVVLSVLIFTLLS